MLHMDWEDCGMVLQNEGHLTMGTERSSEQQVSWQALLAMTREDQHAWVQGRKKDRKTGEDVLLVVQQKDLQAVKSLQRVLHQMEPEGLGVLVLLDSDAQLLSWGDGRTAVDGRNRRYEDDGAGDSEVRSTEEGVPGGTRKEQGRKEQTAGAEKADDLRGHGQKAHEPAGTTVRPEGKRKGEGEGDVIQRWWRLRKYTEPRRS